MATVEFTGPTAEGFSAPAPGGPTPAGRKFHRIREIRLRQGVSLRSAARQMKMDIREVRRQEEETTDLSLSDLQRWQKALDVPITELLCEQDTPLSSPVLERARMVRVMKTVAAILEHASAPGIRRMAQTLADQLIEVMPELEGVSAWHTYGQRRSSNEYGRIVEQPIPDDWVRQQASE